MFEFAFNRICSFSCAEWCAVHGADMEQGLKRFHAEVVFDVVEFPRFPWGCNTVHAV